MGWSISATMSEPPTVTLTFAGGDWGHVYTSGLLEHYKGHPELLICRPGLIEQDYLDLFSGLIRAVAAGAVFRSGDYKEGIPATGHRGRFLAIPTGIALAQCPRAWVGLDEALAPAYAVLQVLLPDRGGHYPDEMDYDPEHRAPQPLFDGRIEEMLPDDH